MAKLKTHKALRKRLHITGRHKLLRRQAGQDHFNARDTGKKTKNKRRDVTLSNTHRKAVQKLIPYR
ncbi:MAG: 50S ribosomal protein L35 [Candidatus Kerfeldbacteria bacterium]|nr:50S ribosomal protein L35 [Candidatus Kerfeldbacteria bacterium]